METAGRPIRRLPLKIVGVIGFFNSALYLAAITGVEDRSGFPEAYVWLTIMILAGGMAWFADGFKGRERLMAISSTVLFFVLALFSAPVFVIIYLMTTMIAAWGWVGVGKTRQDASV